MSKTGADRLKRFCEHGNYDKTALCMVVCLQLPIKTLKTGVFTALFDAASYWGILSKATASIFAVVRPFVAVHFVGLFKLILEHG